MNDHLPEHVVLDDYRLEQVAERAGNALMEHRWHWTLDESNPDRVSVSDYSRAVGKGITTIHQYAHGYEIFRSSSKDMTPNEAVRRAGVSAEKEAVTDIVAQARGLTFSSASRTHDHEIQQVRRAAQERAEEHGTTVEEEAAKLAQIIVKGEKARQDIEDERRTQHDFRFFELDGYLANALRYLAKADKLAGTLAWDDEEKEILADVIDKIGRLTHRIDQRIAGVKEMDWDAELEEILSRTR